MKNTITIILFVVAFTQSPKAQTLIHLYNGKASGSESWTQKEASFTYPNQYGLLVRNVTEPTLTVFKPSKPNGTSVVVCPGGGFIWLSWQSEGTEVAKWLTAKGVTVFVLKYRLVNTGESMSDFEKSYNILMSMMNPTIKKDSGSSPNPKFMQEFMNITGLAIADGVQAMNYVRQHASEYSLDINKVGVIGFSAGTTIAQALSLNTDKAIVPNFTGIVYGGQPTKEKITENAPPLFLLSATDDMASASNPDLYKQWIAAGKQAEIHVYCKGGHGFGMKKQGLPVDRWIERFGDWMRIQGLIR